MIKVFLPNIKTPKKFIAVFVILMSFFLVGNAKAATLSFKIANPKVNVGDTVAVDVILDTEGSSLNVIDGAIGITGVPDIISIQELSTANSSFSYWARNPSLSEKEGIISFVGGEPGGIKQSVSPIFRLYFLAKNSGEVSLSSLETKAYANDGLATPLSVSFTPLSLTIGNNADLVRDEWKQVVSKDLQGPTGIRVDLGQDESLFDGQKFISIFASDSGSGIDHFEVKEGDRSPVRTSDNYVLQNQDQLEPITIFAYDKSGNISRKDLVSQENIPTHGNTGLYRFLIIIAIVLFLGTVIYKIKKKRKKIKKEKNN